MPYIYCIENQINGKKYIGQTSTSLSIRMQRHISDSHRQNLKNRPLYYAMNKYGFENFSITLIEEVNFGEEQLKEIFWIEKFDTYKNGYNATLGGEGAPLYSYKEISDCYIKLQNMTYVAREFNCDIGTVKTACEAYNIIIQKHIPQNSKKIAMLSRESGEIIKVFESADKAGKFLKPNNSRAGANIRECLYGKNKTAYGFKWIYI